MARVSHLFVGKQSGSVHTKASITASNTLMAISIGHPKLWKVRIRMLVCRMGSDCHSAGWCQAIKVPQLPMDQGKGVEPGVRKLRLRPHSGRWLNPKSQQDQLWWTTGIIVDSPVWTLSGSVTESFSYTGVLLNLCLETEVQQCCCSQRSYSIIGRNKFCMTSWMNTSAYHVDLPRQSLHRSQTSHQTCYNAPTLTKTQARPISKRKRICHLTRISRGRECKPISLSEGMLKDKLPRSLQRYRNQQLLRILSLA